MSYQIACKLTAKKKPKDYRYIIFFPVLSLPTTNQGLGSHIRFSHRTLKNDNSDGTVKQSKKKTEKGCE